MLGESGDCLREGLALGPLWEPLPRPNTTKLPLGPLLTPEGVMGEPGVVGEEGRRSLSSSGLARGGRAGREGFFLTLGGVWVSVLEDC